MEAAGIECGAGFDATICPVKRYENCTLASAARALQSANNDWLCLSQLDARLQSVIAHWEQLPEHVKLAVAALVRPQVQ